MTCTRIKKDQLHAYVEGLVSDNDKVEIEKHLAACPECTKAFEDLKQAVHLVGKLDEVEPPAWLTQKIMARIRAEQAPEAGLLKRLLHFLYAGRFPVKITATAAASLVIAVAALLVMKEMGPKIQPIIQPIVQPIIQPLTQDVVTPQVTGPREETLATKSPEQKVTPPADATRLGKPLSAPSATGMREAQPRQSQNVPTDIPSRETTKGVDIVKEKREELREHSAGEAPATTGEKKMTASRTESASTPASPPAPAPPSRDLRKASPVPGAMQAGKDRAESNDMFQAEQAQSQFKTKEGQAAGALSLPHKKIVSERYANGRPKIAVTYRTTASGLTKMMEERFDEAGMRDGLHTAYDEEGRMTAEVLYRHGEIVSAREFNPDGALRAGGPKRDWPWLKPGPH
jgi:hypothetical protein